MSNTENSLRSRATRRGAQAIAVAGFALLVSGGNFAHADITLGSDWVNKGSDGNGGTLFDSFRKFDESGIIAPAVRSGGNTWLKVNVPQQYYTGLAAESGAANPGLTAATIGANPVVQFDLDMTEWNVQNVQTPPDAYISVGYFSIDSSNNQYYGEFHEEAAGLVGKVSHVVANLDAINGGTVAATGRPDAPYLNLVINVLPRNNGYVANSAYFFIDNVKLTPPIVYGTSEWKTNGPGSWNNYDASNWTSTIPNGVDQIATLGTNGGTVGSPIQVSLDSPITVGTVVFNNAGSYTIGGSSNLLLQTSGATSAGIQVLSGNHTITAPMQQGSFSNSATLNAAQSPQFDVAANSSLTLTNLHTFNVTILKTGPGTLSVNSVHNANLSVQGGTLKILPDGTSAGVSTPYSLALAPSATLDLTNNGYTYEYGAATGVQDTVRGLLQSGYAGGSWTGTGGITSSSAATISANHSNIHKTAIGYADSADPDVVNNIPLSVITYFGGSVSGTSILMRYTFAGDTDLDGNVNMVDFNVLAANYGTTGSNWFHGDVNYDGVVNLLDLNAIASNFGQSLPSSSVALGALVPEPTSLAACGFAALLLARRSRKQQG